MRKNRALLEMFALAAMFSGTPGVLPELTEPTRRRVYRETPTKPIPKGHKKFIIEGEEIWALNYKNALKKFLKNKKNS